MVGRTGLEPVTDGSTRSGAVTSPRLWMSRPIPGSSEISCPEVVVRSPTLRIQLVCSGAISSQKCWINVRGSSPRGPRCESIMVCPLPSLGEGEGGRQVAVRVEHGHGGIARERRGHHHGRGTRIAGRLGAAVHPRRRNPSWTPGTARVTGARSPSSGRPGHQEWSE